MSIEYSTCTSPSQSPRVLGSLVKRRAHHGPPAGPLPQPPARRRRLGHVRTRVAYCGGPHCRRRRTFGTASSAPSDVPPTPSPAPLTPNLPGRAVPCGTNLLVLFLVNPRQPSPRFVPRLPWSVRVSAAASGCGPSTAPSGPRRRVCRCGAHVTWRLGFCSFVFPLCAPFQ